MECLATDITGLNSGKTLRNQTEIEKINYTEVFFYDENVEKQNDDDRLKGKEGIDPSIRRSNDRLADCCTDRSGRRCGIYDAVPEFHYADLEQHCQ
jgi:hypothetical protein